MTPQSNSARSSRYLNKVRSDVALTPFRQPCLQPPVLTFCQEAARAATLRNQHPESVSPESAWMAATLDLLGMLGRSMLRAALRLCCLPEQTIDGIERRHMQRDDGGAHLICYLDGVSEELVRRQLEFRRTRKLERSASRTSLSSLDAVSEDGLLDPGALLHSGGLLGIRRNLSTPAIGSLHGDRAPMFSSNSSDRLHLLARRERSRKERA